MGDELPELTVRTVTCHTEGCDNETLPITFPCADEVICGACGHPITDIQ